MHRLYQKANELSKSVIEAAIEVHRHYGEGVLESIYVKSLAQELNLRGHKTAEEVPCTLNYKGRLVSSLTSGNLLLADGRFVASFSKEPMRQMDLHLSNPNRDRNPFCARPAGPCGRRYFGRHICVLCVKHFQ